MVGVVLVGLMVSGVPDAKPDHTFVHATTQYDVYVQEKDSTYEVQVCARYTVTGTRIVRNTCSGPVAQEATKLVQIKQDEDAVSGIELYRRKAANAAKVANSMINSDVEVKTFWKKVGKAIQDG